MTVAHCDAILVAAKNHDLTATGSPLRARARRTIHRLFDALKVGKRAATQLVQELHENNRVLRLRCAPIRATVPEIHGEFTCTTTFRSKEATQKQVSNHEEEDR